MQLIDQIKAIEKYICEYFEAWDLDDPIEEGYLADYQEISGASQEELSRFEETFHLTLPDDFKNSSLIGKRIPIVVLEFQ